MLLDNSRWSALDERFVLQLRFHRSCLLLDLRNFFIQPPALACLVSGINRQKNVAERSDHDGRAGRRLVLGLHRYLFRI